MDFNYDTETISPDQTAIITIGGVQGLEIPASISADRPGSPVVGTIRINTDVATAVLEYWNGTVWVQSSASTGTVTSIAASQPVAGITITGSPITTSGTLTFALANDLAALEGLSTTGLAARTGSDTWALRTIAGTAGNISITDGDGVAGNPTLNLVAAGTAGTYKSVTTDAFGRVTAGTNPTTLAGFGITDAINVSEKGAVNGVATLDGTGKLPSSQLPALAISDTFVVASQAAQVALTAQVGDVAVRTDLNKSFILRVEPASSFANWQELLTPTDAVLSVNGETGAVSVGTVTSVSVATANGLAGTVATSTTTPAITLSTTVTGMVKGNGTALSAATAGTDYSAGTAALATGILKTTTGTGALSIAVAGDFPTLNQNTTGSAATLTTARTISQTGDGTWSVSFNGSANVTSAMTLATVNASPQTDTFRKITVNGKGLVTATSAVVAGDITTALGFTPYNATNPAGYTSNTGTVTSVNLTQPAAGITVSGGPVTTSGSITLALANDLAAVEGLATTGIVRRTATDTWTAGGNIILTSEVTGVLPLANGGTNAALTAANGAVAYSSGTALALTTVGTAGQVLTSTGAGAPIWAASGNGTVTSVSAAQPAAGITITGSPITTSGTLTFALANDLAAIEALNGTGFYTRTGVDTWAARSLTQPAAGITITNPAGTAGNPTFALANDLAAVEGLATTGIAVRTAADTWTTRTVTGTTNQITVTNGDGVAGNPTVAVANNAVFPGTGGTVMPSGTTAERPVSPTNGTTRYNTTLGFAEIYYGGVWYRLGSYASTSGGTGILAIYTGSVPAASGTSAVPFDNTAPLNTEGTEIFNFTLTPVKTTSELRILIPFTVDSGSSNRVVIVSVFRGSLNVGTSVWFATGGGRPNTMVLSVSDTPATISPVTYSVRAGVGNGAATWYINSTSSGNDLGGTLISTYQITEIG